MVFQQLDEGTPSLKMCKRHDLFVNLTKSCVCKSNLSINKAGVLVTFTSKYTQFHNKHNNNCNMCVFVLAHKL